MLKSTLFFPNPASVFLFISNNFEGNLKKVPSLDIAELVCVLTKLCQDKPANENKLDT